MRYLANDQSSKCIWQFHFIASSSAFKTLFTSYIYFVFILLFFVHSSRSSTFICAQRIAHREINKFRSIAWDLLYVIKMVSHFIPFTSIHYILSTKKNKKQTDSDRKHSHWHNIYIYILAIANCDARASIVSDPFCATIITSEVASSTRYMRLEKMYFSTKNVYPRRIDWKRKSAR